MTYFKQELKLAGNESKTALNFSSFSMPMYQRILALRTFEKLELFWVKVNKFSQTGYDGAVLGLFRRNNTASHERLIQMQIVHFVRQVMDYTYSSDRSIFYFYYSGKYEV